jgi:hypothetical protein
VDCFFGCVVSFSFILDFRWWAGYKAACHGSLRNLCFNGLSAAGVPGILQLTERLELHIAAGFQPALHSLTLGFAGLGGNHGLGNDVAAVIRDVTFAIKTIGLNAFLNKGVQELLALGGGYIALVIKGKFKAEFLELTDAVFLAESLLHGAQILQIIIAIVNQIHTR